MNCRRRIVDPRPVWSEPIAVKVALELAAGDCLCAVCRFSDAGTHDANHALRRPASEKRQGTKLRWVGHGGCSKRYGELAAALV